jgi:hypothetical protein
MTRTAVRLSVEPLESRDLPSALAPGLAPSPAGSSIPRHYAHIRIAQLAYGGTPLGRFEEQLLRNSVDLVIANPAYLARINAVAPRTPQLLYTNLSSLYLDLLTDWLNYADRRGFDREAAFYHADRPVPFTGASSSSRPVNWFWRVYRGSQPGRLTDVTSAANQPSRRLAFGAAGEGLYLGYPDRFREINLSLASGASRGWSAGLEYPSAVDAAGRPTRWSPLRINGNTTGGLTRSGRITFDPPADWKTATLGGPERLFYVRFRTSAGGTAPVARTVLGRDYVGAGGRPAGVIPVFDAAADQNRDGYLDDAEYARRARGQDARFLYESRVFDANYGPMRPATNPSTAAFREWAVDYYFRFLNDYEHADGLFVDNSRGSATVKEADVREPVASYGSDYALLLEAVTRRLAPRWVVPNTYAGDEQADQIVRRSSAYYAEFAIRPLAHHYRQFEELAEIVHRRAALGSPAPYAILDSLPMGGSPTDPRTQLATLAYYYLIADPATTFLNFYGGFETSTGWARHWVPAAAYDIGPPAGGWSLFAEGADPADRGLTYRVYQRSFGRALVLYKPLSYGPGGRAPGSLSDRTATTHRLDGVYRPLRADGTLGAPIGSVSLRNGEGAILIRTSA